jgi:hypothetical protein
VDSNTVVALASLLAALGATSAAIVAAYALRSQQRAQQRQNDLENLRWITDQYAALRPLRRRAAEGFLDGTVDEDALRDVLNFFETGGYLVREGFITEKTFDQVGKLTVLGWWYATESFIRDVRRRVGDDGVFEEFEWLKDRLRVQVFEPSRAWVDGFLRREAARPAIDSQAKP